MRPIHALLLVLFLGAVLGGALWLVQSDNHSGRIAGPIAGTEGGGGEPMHTSPVLDGTGGTHTIEPGAERAHISSGGTAAIASGPIGVRGRVVDPEGRGVAGATVYAASSDMPMGFALDDSDSTATFVRRKETTTDSEGRFTLEPEARGAIRLAVRADGFAPFNAQKPIAGTNVDVGDLKLERGVVISGRVLDAGGNAVANAALHLAKSNEPSGIIALPGSRGPLLATTNTAGEFRIDLLAVGSWSVLIASAEHPDKTESGETDRAGQVVSNVVITLDAGFEITGRVVGGPAAGFGELRVGASERTDGEGVFVGFANQRKSAIQADGSFRVKGCKRDTGYRLTVRKTEHGFPSGSRSDTVNAKSGDTNVVLTYRAETAITCKVVDKISGQPVENMQVSAGFKWPIPLMEEGTPKTRRNFPGGVVRFAPLSGGAISDSATLRIEAVGFATFERNDLRLTAGIDNDIGVIQLERSALVKITVVDDSTGVGIANASVSLNVLEKSGTEIGMTFTMDVDTDSTHEFGGPGAAQRGKTDKEGRVSLSSLPGRRATLSVQHREHAAWKSAPIDLPAIGDHEIVVRMTAGGTVVVEVVDAEKKPVASLAVDHRDPESGGRMLLPGMKSGSVTDAAGRVVFAHIPAGRHLFRVRAASGGGMFEGAMMTASFSGENVQNEMEKGWSEVVAREGEIVTLTLAAPELGELHGRVREAGKALAGATVRLRTKRTEGPDFDLPFLSGGASAVTNASGDYVLAGNVVGEYELVVGHPSRAMKWTSAVDVRTGAVRFDVDLPLATIEGRVSDEAGKPIEGAKVTVERVKKAEVEERGEDVEMQVVMLASGDEEGEIVSFGGEDAPVVKTDADGRYKLRGVTPAVPLQVVASGKDFQPTRSARIELTNDQTVTGFDLTCKPGGAVEVTVRRLDGRAVSGAVVRAELVGGDAAPKTLFTGPEGRAMFQGLAPGRWKLTCGRTAFDPSARDAKATPREVDVRSGRTEKLVFDMPQ